MDIDHFFSTHQILVGTHRGLTLDNQIQANTIQAFFQEDTKDADFIECDCVMTADGVVILHHDATIDAYPISMMTWSKVQSLSRGIESLDTLLHYLISIESQKGLYLELKPYETTQKRHYQFVEAVIKLVTQYAITDRCMVVSFDSKLLALSKKLNPSIPIGLNGEVNQQHSMWALTHQALRHEYLPMCDMICPHISGYKAEWLGGKRLLLWEHQGEHAILDYLNRFNSSAERHAWCKLHQIAGFCTNTVSDVIEALNE